MTVSDGDLRHATTTVGRGRPGQAKNTFVIEFVITESRGTLIVVDRKASLATNLTDAEREARSWLPELRRRHKTTPPNGFRIRDIARHFVLRSWGLTPD
jgi:hypothetical protein